MELFSWDSPKIGFMLASITYCLYLFEIPHFYELNSESLIFPLLKLSLDFIEEWVSNNLSGSMLGEGDDDLNIRVIATYQSSDGLMELKVVFNLSML